jgi:UDP-N-acetylmuramate--alanine ligase
MNLNDYKHVYLIGIGGISISAVAKLLLHHNIKVSGFDLVDSDVIKELIELGAEVTINDKTNLPRDVDLVIYSEAVTISDTQRTQAKAHNIKQLSGSEFWGEYSKNKKVIAISGTNGKSTTTTMVGIMLEQAGLDPTVVVGTRVLAWDSNIRIGKSKWLVIEADEYAAKMLNFKPDIAVITNISADHLDYYKDTGDIINHFQTWIDSMDENSYIILNRDDENCKTLTAPENQVIEFGNGGNKGIRSVGITIGSGVESWVGKIGFNIVDEIEDWGYIEFRVPGTHNVINSVAAAVAADKAGVSKKQIINALWSFKGTWRRFELVGEYNKALIVSDYAHHPDGIKATLEAARGWYPFNRIVVLFEPHQHNRTKNLFNDFVNAFSEADELIISEVYDVAGRTEGSDQDVSSKELVDAISKDSVTYATDLQNAEEILKEKIKPQDVVIVMGAGDVDIVARNLVNAIKR